jgi:isocitrate dehydrogenase
LGRAFRVPGCERMFATWKLPLIRILQHFGNTFHNMQTTYNGLELPKDGQPIDYKNGQFEVPDHPIIPFIEGDGTGRDIWKASQRVFDAAVEKAYGGKRAIAGLRSSPAKKPSASSDLAARRLRGRGPRPARLHQGTADHAGRRRHPLAQRGPAPDSRPLRLRAPGEVLPGRAQPVKHPEKLDIVIFRENTEDVYAGIEFKRARRRRPAHRFPQQRPAQGGKKKVRADSGVGIKPISIFGTKRLVRYAIRARLESGRKTVTLVHKGNIQKFTEGAFREWGYEVAVEEFREQTVTERESWILGNVDANPGLTVEQNARSSSPASNSALQAFRDSVYAEVKAVLDSIGKTHGNGAWKSKMLINDRIADSIFQQIIIRPRTTAFWPPPTSTATTSPTPRGAGRRPRHRSRRQHRRRLRRLRSHARHRAQVCRQGRHQSRLGDSVRRHAARLHRLERSRQAHRDAWKRPSCRSSSPTTSSARPPAQPRSAPASLPPASSATCNGGQSVDQWSFLRVPVP